MYLCDTIKEQRTMRNDLQKKIDNALFLIEKGAESAKKCGQPLEICYSGGKDSDVILELAKEAGVPFEAIYKNTTIDPPHTHTHCKSKGVKIVQPQRTFAQIIQDKGFPSRYARFCCSELKEYKIYDNAVVGVRKAESKKRAEIYKEPIICRVYGKKTIKTQQFLPILEWSDKDVADFVESKAMTCHPLYYDESGKFCVERRLGCLCCPLQSRNKRIAEFKKYPNFVRFYCKNGQKWLDLHPHINTRGTDIFEKFVMTTFFVSFDDFLMKTTGLFGKVDCKEFLQNYFGVDLNF